jgi:hypothetical protein
MENSIADPLLLLSLALYPTIFSAASFLSSFHLLFLTLDDSIILSPILGYRI